MNKKLFLTCILALTLLCATACGRRMNSATDGSDKTDQNTPDTTVEDNNGNGTLTDGTNNNDNNDYNTIDNFDNGTTNDNVVDGVIDGAEDAVDGVIDGVDDVVDGTENTVNDLTDTN